MTQPSIIWFRQDLRLADQAALAAAAVEGPVLPIYILDDESPGKWRLGGAQRWWLHQSLTSLDASLRGRGCRLILRRGRSPAALAALAGELGTKRIHAIRHSEPWWIKAEDEIAADLDLRLHEGNHLAPPGEMRNGSGASYRIYTPFQRALFERMPPAPPAEAPERLPAPAAWPASETLEEWALLPVKPDWSTGFGAQWTPGEAGARERLAGFRGRVEDYEARRNLPSEEGTSRLSPHLHFGEISPAAIWHVTAGRSIGATTFRKELAWRDFAAGLTRLFPYYGLRNGRAAFDGFPWRSGAAANNDLHAWQQGRTGYPIVDAGMRQLWTSGWMHNRARMIAASFLVKHLLIDWREGERWFWDTLLDADYGNNSTNWQWVAGTGVDAMRFERIMAPLLQSEKFDAAGYIRRWVPELADLPDRLIHDPHAHGCAPEGYPPKLIEHRAARERALAALSQ